MNDSNSGFAEYRRLILKELERLNEADEARRETLEELRREDLPNLRQEFRDALLPIRTDITSLKERSTLKATLISAAAGAAPAIVILLYFLANQK